MHYRKVNNPGMINIGKYTTSKKELVDLFKSWLVISIAFSIVRIGFNLSFDFLETLLISAITVGTAFLLHEIGHKLVAQHYGCFAEFRSNDKMLIVGLLLSFLGFIFFAPGAVLISGIVGKRRNGIISAAGPGTNFLFAVLFIVMMFIVSGEFWFNLALFGYLVNTYLGLFNMIPFLIFDGKKILQWNKAVYYIMLAIGFILLFSQNIITGIVQ